MFTTKPAVQPDNCRGSLIPQQTFIVGRITVQSASRDDMIVQYCGCSDSMQNEQMGYLYAEQQPFIIRQKFELEKGTEKNATQS